MGSTRIYAVSFQRKRLSNTLLFYSQMELPPIEVVTPRNYGDLSHALRQDKFGGYTFHNPSLMKESHTQEVYDRRYKDPDEFRHHWDEYGKFKSVTKSNSILISIVCNDFCPLHFGLLSVLHYCF